MLVLITKAVSLLFHKTYHALYWSLDLCMPKADNLLVFMQAEAEYSGNPRAVFDSIHQSLNGRLHAVWLVGSSDVRQRIRSRYGVKSAYKRSSLTGFILALRARGFVSSHGLSDYKRYAYFSHRTFWIELWHGMPLKTLGVLAKSRSYESRSKFFRGNQRCSLLISSSRLDRLCMAACLGVRADHIVVSGLPRNDVLLKSPAEPCDLRTSDARMLKKKLVLYAPTFRDSGSSEFLDLTEANLDDLNRVLEAADAYLMLRLHIRDRARLQEKLASLGHVNSRLWLPGLGEFEEAQELLPWVDVLVTDYSSIYLDFLLLDRPIIFLASDVGAYEAERGFSYDYEAMTPGPKVSSFNDFLPFLESALLGDDAYEAERNRLQSMFHRYVDGNNTERTLAAIETLLYEYRVECEPVAYLGVGETKADDR